MHKENSNNKLETDVQQEQQLPELGEPYLISVLADKITPVLAFEKLRRHSTQAFLFESSESDSRLARFSILSIDPVETIVIRKNCLELKKKDSEPQVIESKDGFAFLAQRCMDLNRRVKELQIPEDLPFTAAYVGYLAYGATAIFDAIDQQESDPFENVPDGIFSFYDSLIIFDHKERQMRILSFRGKNQCQKLLALLTEPEESDSSPVLGSLRSEISLEEAFRDVRFALQKNEYMERVERCIEYIKEGQVFQIVLANRFTRSFDGDPFAIYRALQSINPSPYGYYLQFQDFVYLGASPERLLACRNGAISLTALAGTRKRGKDKTQDREMEIELRSSEKEMAEHYMLVDLGRNDLGRVAEIGSVNCGEIARITHYGQVMHLSTDIEAKLAAGRNCFDALRSCFPAGTVSGAPKIRAMELLSQLEPEKRGVYSGLVGYFDINLNSDSAIAIRSALITGGQAHINAGAGIVLDSKPEEEYLETRNKALSVLKACRLADSM